MPVTASEAHYAEMTHPRSDDCGRSIQYNLQAAAWLRRIRQVSDCQCHSIRLGCDERTRVES